MKFLMILALYSTTSFAGGGTEGGSAGGTGSDSGTSGGTKGATMSKYKENDSDMIESGKRCLNVYNANYKFEKEITVASLQKAITDEITKPKKSVGRSIASVSEAPNRIESMECNLFARDVGDKEFLNLVLPADAPASVPSNTDKTGTSGSVSR